VNGARTTGPTERKDDNMVAKPKPTAQDAPRPQLVNARRAGTELLATKVVAGHITEGTAREILTIGFPFVTRTIANWRREGMSADRITEEFDRRASVAKSRGRNLAEASAEFYAAVWTGMQEDLAVFLAQTSS
jgi:hypothetical protein